MIKWFSFIVIVYLVGKQIHKIVQSENDTDMTTAFFKGFILTIVAIYIFAS